MGGIMNRPYQVHGQGSKGFTRVQSLLDALVWLQDLAPFLTVGICEIAPAALRKKDRAGRPANNHQRRVVHRIDTRSTLCAIRILYNGIRANILTPVPYDSRPTPPGRLSLSVSVSLSAPAQRAAPAALMPAVV